MINNENLDLSRIGVMRRGKFVSIFILPDVDVLLQELTAEIQVHKYQTVQIALMLLKERLSQPVVIG